MDFSLRLTYVDFSLTIADERVKDRVKDAGHLIATNFTLSISIRNTYTKIPVNSQL